MINAQMLALLKQLRVRPRTRREQTAFMSVIGIRRVCDLFVEHGLIELSEADNRTCVMTITPKGVEIVKACEKMESLGVEFE
jgi:predicted transcriptional regulator